MDDQFPQLNPSTLVPSLNPTLVTDGATLDRAVRFLQHLTETTKQVAWDYETNVTPTFFHRRARTWQFGNRDEQYVVDLLAFAGSKEALIGAQGLYRGQGIGAFRAIRPHHEALIASTGHLWKLLDPVVDALRPFFESNTLLKLGHNLEFEYTVSKWCLGMRPWHFYCSQVAERMILNGAVRADEDGHFKLDDVTKKYCRFSIDKGLQQSFDLETPLTPEQIVYCALDCRIPFAIRAGQMKVIERDGLARSVQIEMDAIPAFGDLHLNGLGLSADAWRQIISENQRDLVDAIAEMDRFFLPVVGKKVKWDEEEIARKEAVYQGLREKSTRELEISAELRTCRKDAERTAALKAEREALETARKAACTRAKEEFYAERSKASAKAREDYAKMEGEAAINYASQPQLLEALRRGPFGLNATNFKDTNDKTMEKHASKPVIGAIRKYRALKKLIGTYGERWLTPRDQKDAHTGKPGYMDADTGRIHSNFWQLGADTGRPSATNPNILNQPRDDRYRSAYQSRPGYDMVTKDCAGQELRILTEHSQEQAWVDAFRKGQDVHSISAALISPSEWRSKALPNCAYFVNDGKLKCKCPAHKEMRDIYKALNFGIAYDKQAYSLSIELGVSKDEAQEVLNGWKATFATTQKALEHLRDSAYENEEGRTLSGRRRLSKRVTWDQAKRACEAKYKGQYDQDAVMKMYHALIAGVKRELGNFPIQGAGADLMKRAMGCGFDENGKPYLWHLLEPEWGALMCNFVYDEFLTESPEEHSEAVSVAVSDAIIRAGAELVKVVPMESEGAIAKRWSK